jgi:hypothetical protein
MTKEHTDRAAHPPNEAVQGGHHDVVSTRPTSILQVVWRALVSLIVGCGFVAVAVVLLCVLFVVLYFVVIGVALVRNHVGR